MATCDSDGPCAVAEVNPDIHICGFCKQQYNNYEVFLAHKQKGCCLPPSHAAASSASTSLSDCSSEFVLEDAYQVCVVRGVKKSLTKAEKAPSKKLKPALSAKRHSCCFSGCTFKTQYGQKDMERHLKTHTGEKPFECELCHKRFSRRDKLNMHSRSHTGERPHKCKHCSYAAADSSSLKKHLRIHYDERPFKCQICPYASRNSSQLTVHLRSHTGDAPFQCQQCDAKFKINSDLKRHLRVHSGEKPYKCDFCEYRCAMKGNLKSHARLKHGTENPFRCERCDYTSASRLSLRQHARQHLPAQPFQCSRCSYSSARRGALKLHERVHSEERPFGCDLCGFAAKRLSCLFAHREQCHSDNVRQAGRGLGSPQPVGSRYRAKLDAARAFHCDLCAASFVRADSLRSHKKQHRDARHAADSAQLVPGPEAQAGAQTHPLPPSSVASYGDAQIKIIVQQPLGHHGSLTPADADRTGEAKVVLPEPDNQDLAANLLAAGQPLRSSRGTEPQTVPLTRLGPDITTPPDSCSRPALIAFSSDLEGFSALMPDAGADLRVALQKSSPSATAAPPSDASGSKATAARREAALVVPSLGGQNVLVQCVPLIVCAAPQQASLEPPSPQTQCADSHTPGSTAQ